MKTYRITHLPTEFCKVALAAYNSLDGSLYILGTKLVFTDEAEDLDNPRSEFSSFEEFEDWLVQCAIDWLSDGKDDCMAIALNEHL